MNINHVGNSNKEKTKLKLFINHTSNKNHLFF